jgi:hypothetical protein
VSIGVSGHLIVIVAGQWLHSAECMVVVEEVEVGLLSKASSPPCLAWSSMLLLGCGLRRAREKGFVTLREWLV